LIWTSENATRFTSNDENLRISQASGSKTITLPSSATGEILYELTFSN
jgi:hypothetical protein